MEPKDRILVAIDMPNVEEAASLAKNLSPYVGGFKVGLELLTSEGAPNVVERFSTLGRIFFDGKFKDIPNTVAGASRAATRLGVWMFNVHCLGGISMMREAKLSADEEAKKLGIKGPLVIGVTVLTSLDVRAINEVGFEHVRDENELKKLVVRLALLAKQAGLDGVVASPQETSAIRKACGDNFLIVTPGVRPSFAAANDQKRITTPTQALESGANYLVIGRPITNPPKEVGSAVDAAKRIVEEIVY